LYRLLITEAGLLMLMMRRDIALSATKLALRKVDTDDRSNQPRYIEKKSKIEIVCSVWQQCMLDSHITIKYKYKLYNKSVKI